MKRLQLLIRTFFGFSRMETNAFLLFIPLIGIILFSEPMYHQFFAEDKDSFRDILRTDSLLALLEQDVSKQDSVAKSKKDTIAFHRFDPNTAPEKQLVALGLPKALAGRIVKYREKGGSFREKNDLLRIFGMDTTWFRKARSWMKIESGKENSTAVTKNVNREKAKQDINSADSSQLDAVYGVGPVLARRIMQFRDRLGGFVSMDQLSEVYGLDTVVVKNLKRRFEVRVGFLPKTLSLNEVSLEDLMAHPYISRREAQAIYSYRSQHGAFDSLGQLKEIKLIDANWVERIRLYARVAVVK